MRKSFKLRLYPNAEQKKSFENILGLCCDLYNAALQERTEAWKLQRKSLTLYDQIKELPELKKALSEFNKVYSQTLGDVLQRLDKAFGNFFRRVKSGEKSGYPRFRSKRRYDSFTYPQTGFKIKERRIFLSKLGEIKFKACQPEIPGRIKTCTVKRDVEQWYAILSCDEVPEKLLPKTGESVGIDMGLEFFATLSTGEQIENPRHARKMKTKLHRAQRKLSRAKKGSRRRKKQAVRVAKIHRKIKRQRKDFHFKLAVELVRRFDVIHFEQLNIRNMVRNHKLAFSISDAAWFQFQMIASCKAVEAGKTTTFSDARNTSNECNESGEIKKKKLSERWHTLPSGKIIHRDHNAAINIKRRGARRQALTLVQ